MEKLKILISGILIIPFISCGCWNYREIDTLAIVGGLAIDRDTTNNKFKVSVEIVNTNVLGTTTSIDSEVYSSEGDSIFEAIRDLIEKTGLRLYWSDAKVIIVSNQIAREGIIPVIDWINRDSEVRSDMWLIISRENTAAAILNKKVMLNRVVSFHLDDGMNSEKTISKFVDSKLMTFIDKMSGAGGSGVVATVENEGIDGSVAPRINGCAIFKGDKLIGFLNGEETLYLLMIRNKIKEGLITVKNVLSLGTNVTLEIFKNKTKLLPVYKNGLPSVSLIVRPTLGIAEIEGTGDLMSLAKLEEIELETDKFLKEKMEGLINKLQTRYDADVFGFEEAFEKNKPKCFQQLMEGGKDFFRSIGVQIQVKVSIKGSGKTNRAITNKVEQEN